jgi:DNA helicase-2/ATP-dependent DNA helicase PcrA
MLVSLEQHLEALADLTPSQRQAVTTTSGMVCVLAAAGTGKTRVLTRRALYRVATGTAKAEHVLAITFTRKAAGELKERLGVAGTGPGGVSAGTFHSIANSQLRRWWADRRTPEPVLLERKARLLDELLDARRALDGVSAADLASHIEWAKARDISPASFAEEASRAGRELPADADAIAALYSRYEDEKRRRRLVDFDDLIARYAGALETDGRFAAAQRWRWQHLFVDELQDVNPLQYRLLMALLGERRDLFVVGDPNQAIYSWNGADPTLLDSFPHQWPEAEVVRLDDNHRSSPQVVAAAACVLGRNAAGLRSSQPDGPLPQVRSYASEDAEARGVASQAREAHARGVPWGQMAVLARTNAQLGAIGQALAQIGAPFHALAPVEDQEPATGPGGELTGPAADEAVTVCSFHRAKGLQWHAVWACGLEAGLVPIGYATSTAALAEERRLLYVAMTRAERELYCSWAETRRTSSGAALRRDPSPWLAAVNAERAGEAGTAQDTMGGAAVVQHLASARRRLGRAAGLGAGDPADDPARAAAVEGLREWRRRMARASGIPPHVLLHDSTLQAIAARRPVTAEELLAVPGLGPVKVARFGPAILGAVQGGRAPEAAGVR